MRSSRRSARDSWRRGHENIKVQDLIFDREAVPPSPVPRAHQRRLRRGGSRDIAERAMAFLFGQSSIDDERQ